VERPFDVTALRDAAHHEIADGLRACQIAVGHDGDIIWTEGFGEATEASRFLVMSATKPIVASAAWVLMGDGLLDIDKRVADYIPEFGANGKDGITVEQVMVMTAGFPSASMAPDDGATSAGRRARMAEWELEYEPGTQYAYHASSAHWVMAELIEHLSGTDYRDYVARTVTTPLGLPRLLGIPRREQDDIVGIDRADPSVDDLVGDRRAMIEVGVPAGGGVMTAATLTRFYQGLLHNPAAIWKPDVLADGTSHVRTTLPDPLLGMPANRTTGVVVGNGFGSSWGRSPTAFGWPGAGGQIAFADPATGISFAFLQNGDPDQISAFGRGHQFSNLALSLG